MPLSRSIWNPGEHCMVYTSPVTGLGATTIGPPWYRRPTRTLWANGHEVWPLATPECPSGQMVTSSLAWAGLAVARPSATAPAARPPRISFFMFGFLLLARGWALPAGMVVLRRGRGLDEFLT